MSDDNGEQIEKTRGRGRPRGRGHGYTEVLYVRVTREMNLRVRMASSQMNQETPTMHVGLGDTLRRLIEEALAAREI